MTRYYLPILLFFCIFPVFSQTPESIIQFINTNGFEGASIGICIKDIEGKEIASYNKNTALVPASTLKIITTATALEVLGENYQFKTELIVDKDKPQNLIIRGYGDPTLGSEFLDNAPNTFLHKWAEIVSKSIKSEDGIDIKVDDSYFGYRGVSGKWLQEDLGNYYASGTYGISVFDNTYKLYFDTTDPFSSPQILKTSPSMNDLFFDNQMTVNTTGKDSGYISGEPLSNYRKLIGNIPANKKSFFIKGDIPDPGLYLGQVLADILRENQVQVNNISTTRKNFSFIGNQIRKAIDEKEKQILFTQYSPYLKEIIKVINVRSNNHYSEHLIRTIGRNEKETALYFDPLDRGINFVKKYWQSKGIDTNSLFMYDGCGLAPSNKVTPELLCDILIYMQNESPYKESFFNSFPKAGKEGTVKNFLKGGRLEGKVAVKSGSISEVQCFAGYYEIDNQQYVFTVIVNNYNSPRRNVVRAIEKLLLAIF